MSCVSYFAGRAHKHHLVGKRRTSERKKRSQSNEHEYALGLKPPALDRYRFFHPPLCPGAPPVERGAGPNSGPDWRESVGWKILLPLRGAVSSGEGFRDDVRSGRKGRDSGPCISSRWGLWILDEPRLVDPPSAFALRASADAPQPSPR